MLFMVAICVPLANRDHALLGEGSPWGRGEIPTRDLNGRESIQWREGSPLPPILTTAILTIDNRWD